MGLLKQLMGEEPFFWQDMAHAKDDTGEYGEWLTEFALNRKTIPGTFFVLHNIFVPWKGKTTEIDILLLHRKGIFVIESKNLSGSIYGAPEDLHWTQYLGGQKSRFYNPVRQNETHMTALSAFIGVPRQDISSYVVFSNRCRLGDMPQNMDGAIVVHRDEMVKELRYDLRHRKALFTNQQLENIKSLLERFSAAHSMDGHVKDLKGKCPYCGAPLVRRVSPRTGRSFVGCSNYPSCRYTASL